MARTGLRGLAGTRKRYVNREHLVTTEDLVNRNFTATAPNQLWCTDITEHPTREGKIYCCCVIDVYSRKVVGWAIDMRQTALLQRLAAVRGRLSLCADQAAAAKWWLSMPMASVSAEGPMPKALSTRRTSPLMPGCRHQGRACPLRRARMTSNPLIVA